MAETVTLPDREYSLSEAAILPEPLPSTASDQLAQWDILPTMVSRPCAGWRWLIKGTSLPSPIRIRSAFTPSPQLEGSFHQIVELLGLPAGWNSYSAQPVSWRSAVAAIRFLVEFMEPATPPPVIVPTVRGGLQVEWHANGVDIEVYIESGQEVRFFTEAAGVGEIEAPLEGHQQEFRQWLGRVTER